MARTADDRSNVIDLATAREAWLGSMVYEPGRSFLDPDNAERHDRAWADYRAAKEAAETPVASVPRLLREADALDARAVPARAEADEFFGKAAYREQQGEADLAAQFLSIARGAERFAIKLEAEAFAKRLKAAEIAATRVVADGMRSVIAQIASAS